MKSVVAARYGEDNVFTDVSIQRGTPWSLRPGPLWSYPLVLSLVLSESPVQGPGRGGGVPCPGWGTLAKKELPPSQDRGTP